MKKKKKCLSRICVGYLMVLRTIFFNVTFLGNRNFEWLFGGDTYFSLCLYLFLSRASLVSFDLLILLLVRCSFFRAFLCVFVCVCILLNFSFVVFRTVCLSIFRSNTYVAALNLVYSSCGLKCRKS